MFLISAEYQKALDENAIFHKMVQLMPYIVHIHRLSDQALLYANAQLSVLLGYTVSDIKAQGGSLIFTLVSEKQKDFLLKMQETENGEEGWQYETEVQHKDGSLHLLRTHAIPFRRNEAGQVTEVLGISEDITLEKEKQTTASQQKAVMAQAEKMLHFGSWEWDIAKGEMFWSEGLFELFGYSQANRPEKTTIDIYRSRMIDYDSYRKADEAFFSLKQDYESEKVVRKLSGEEIIILERGRFLLDEAGEVIRVIGSTADITESRQLYYNLRRNEALLSETEKIFNFGSWEWDVYSNQVIWSDGLYQIFGLDKKYFKDHLTAELYFSFILPDARDKLTQTVQDAVENQKSYEIEHEFTRNDGSVGVLLGRGTPVFDEKGLLIKYMGSATDVSDSRKSLAKLIESEALLSESQRVLNYGSWSWDVSSDSIHWSDNLWRLFDYDPDANQNRSVALDFYLSHVHPEDKEKVLTKNSRFIETGEQEEDYEHRIITHLGNTKIFDGKARVLEYRDGKPSRVVGSTVDVTNMKKIERELEQKVREFHRSNEELEQFAYVASHDLQEPLRKITSFADRLRSKYNYLLGDDGRMYLDRITDAAQRMKSLIDNLLNFSRISRRTESMVVADLNELLRNVISDLEIKIEEKNSRIVTAELPEIEAISPQISRLFLNLLSNALKFSREGVTPEVIFASEKASRDEKQQLELDKDKEYVKITVSDNGIGFEQEFAEKIFVIFQRLHGRSEYEGTGIGLAICKKIVENHNGRIIAESQPGIGTVFSIFLPVRQG